MQQDGNHLLATFRRRFRGVVKRAVLPKTVTVEVERFFRHPRVRRVVRRQRKFLVHDEKGVAKEGDEVFIEEARPLSRHKRWRVIEIVRNARIEAAQEESPTEEDDLTAEHRKT